MGQKRGYPHHALQFPDKPLALAGRLHGRVALRCSVGSWLLLAGPGALPSTDGASGSNLYICWALLTCVHSSPWGSVLPPWPAGHQAPPSPASQSPPSCRAQSSVPPYALLPSRHCCPPTLPPDHKPGLAPSYGSSPSCVPLCLCPGHRVLNPTAASQPASRPASLCLGESLATRPGSARGCCYHRACGPRSDATEAAARPETYQAGPWTGPAGGASFLGAFWLGGALPQVGPDSPPLRQPRHAGQLSPLLQGRCLQILCSQGGEDGGGLRAATHSAREAGQTPSSTAPTLSGS